MSILLNVVRKDKGHTRATLNERKVAVVVQQRKKDYEKVQNS